MASQFARISGDGHLHIYPWFRLDLAFDSLLANLDRNARAFWQCDPQDTIRLAFLTERADCHFFEQLRNGTIDILSAGLEIVEPREATCLTLLHRGSRQIRLIAGRQINTRERLEVLGLAMTERVPDGLSARETIELVVAAKGYPVLPWAPGKWMGSRGRVVRDLASGRQPGAPALGDSSLRPMGLPEPALMRAARRRGLLVMPGSDPLPLPGEEQLMGAYGFVYEGPFDAERPTDSVRALLADNAGQITPAGRRRSILQVITSLYGLRKAMVDK